MRPSHRGQRLPARRGVRFLGFMVGLIGLLAATGSAPLAAPAGAVDAISGYRLPWKYNESHNITQNWNNPYSHYGIDAYAYDISMYRETVVAAARGTVAYVRSGQTECGGPEDASKANRVTINHDDGTATLYTHLESVSVSVGQIVASGQKIGTSGRTGYTNCTYHLHFARQAQGSAVTQTRAIYFEEYPWFELPEGQTQKSKNPDCKQTAADRPHGAFCGTYFKGIFQDNVEYFARKESWIDFAWAAGPGGMWLNSTTSFSARYVGEWGMGPDTYKFTLRASDGVRLYVDGVKEFEDWRDRTSAATFTEYVTVPTAGDHVIKVEYYNKGSGAVIEVDWESCNHGC